MGATSPTVACSCTLACTVPRTHGHPYSHSHHSAGASATSPAIAHLHAGVYNRPRPRSLIFAFALTITVSIAASRFSHALACTTLTPTLSRSLARVPRHQPSHALARWCTQWPAPAIARIRLRTHYHRLNCSLAILTCNCVHDAHAQTFVRFLLFAFVLSFGRSLSFARSLSSVRPFSFVRSLAFVPFATSSLPTDRKYLPLQGHMVEGLGDLIWAVC
jgi:hypothetical protein